MNNDKMIAVIGDVMLDIYHYGDCERLSPEAPVPVFNSHKKVFFPGGAANTFMNLVKMGVPCKLFSTAGDDSNHAKLFSLMLDMGATPDQIVIFSEDRPTIVKERIVARSQQIIRLDTESRQDITHQNTNKIICNLMDLRKQKSLSCAIISDYGKGVINKELVKQLTELDVFPDDPIRRLSDSRPLIFIDPKVENKHLYYGFGDLITPNMKEFNEMGGKDAILKDLKVNAILRTEGSQGMTYFGPNPKEMHFDTVSQTVYDVSGAGDTVIAALTAGVYYGLGLIKAIRLANLCAGNVVSRMGTTAVETNFFKQTINAMLPKDKRIA